MSKIKFTHEGQEFLLDIDAAQKDGYLKKVKKKYTAADLTPLKAFKFDVAYGCYCIPWIALIIEIKGDQMIYIENSPSGNRVFNTSIEKFLGYMNSDDYNVENCDYSLTFFNY